MHSNKEGFFSSFLEHSHLVIGLAMLGSIGWYINDYHTRNHPLKTQPKERLIEKAKEKPAAPQPIKLEKSKKQVINEYRYFFPRSYQERSY